MSGLGHFAHLNLHNSVLVHLAADCGLLPPQIRPLIIKQLDVDDLEFDSGGLFVVLLPLRVALLAR